MVGVPRRRWEARCETGNLLEEEKPYDREHGVPALMFSWSAAALLARERSSTAHALAAPGFAPREVLVERVEYS